MQGLSTDEGNNDGELPNFENQEHVMADSKNEEPDLMANDEEGDFVYEEMEQRIESLMTQHQDRLASTPSPRPLIHRPFNARFYSVAASARYDHFLSMIILNQRYLPLDAPKLLDARKIIESHI